MSGLGCGVLLLLERGNYFSDRGREGWKLSALRHDSPVWEVRWDGDAVVNVSSVRGSMVITYV